MWRGRLRSIERLVCNFAPRGPPVDGALWIPGPPATACPLGTKRDAHYTYLCSHS